MQVKDILAKIDWYFPWMTACDFDNVGLLVGDESKTVKRAVVALDCTAEVLDFAISQNADAVITHHPVIFEPLKSVTAESVVFRAIQNGISVISAHTNFDIGVGGVNYVLCEKLGLKIKKRLMIDGLLVPEGEFENGLSPAEVAALCKQSLPTSHVAFTSGNKKIKRVVVCSGSGSSLLHDVMRSGADAFITGELKHSSFIEAHNAGFSAFSCGHFETEDIAIPALRDILCSELPDIEWVDYRESPIKHI